MEDEQTPLLSHSGRSEIEISDPHLQFCALTGIAPSNLPKDANFPKPSRTSLYVRATKRRSAQNRKYLFTAAVTNTLLLSQVVIGAALTALGASSSSHILITIFGALNTVIAGIVTYLKSRGQPMRARMFRDDLERVVDQIEDSEIMWMGIAHGMHGYDEIDIDDEVSVRSEVARLTRLYDRAMRNNTENNPDMYLQHSGNQDPLTGLKSRPAPIVTPPAPSGQPALGPAAPVVDADESPATKTPITPKEDQQVSVPKPTTKSSKPVENQHDTSKTDGTLTPLASDMDEGPVTNDPKKGSADSK
jgi:hypothetical protein